jgi:hypothetical protein
MTIEIITFLGFVFTATSLIAKAHERRQDVLYGPYIQRRRPRHPLASAIHLTAYAIRASDLPRHVEQIGWKARHVSCIASAIIC